MWCLNYGFGHLLQENQTAHNNFFFSPKEEFWGISTFSDSGSLLPKDQPEVFQQMVAEEYLGRYASGWQYEY